MKETRKHNGRSDDRFAHSAWQCTSNEASETYMVLSFCVIFPSSDVPFTSQLDTLMPPYM